MIDNGAIPEPGDKPYNWLDELVCPDCAAPLNRKGETLVCERCGRCARILDGVPHFVSDFPYWGEIPQAQMMEINQQAETGSWRSALLDSKDPAVKRASVMILNLARANWQWLIDLPPSSRVLDVGAGTGTNAHSLALHYAEVVALEPVLERIRFMQHRFSQERLSNVRIVRTSIWDLPFAPESFNLVAMNGVLEWVAEGRAGDPGDLQETAIRKVHRLLRAGGYLYLGIENRHALGYYVGYPDPHCGLPFVPVLPRMLAQSYAHKRGHNGYRNYLYSSRGYRKLLQNAGFTAVQVYLALPSYNHPQFLIPLDHKVSAYYFRNFAHRSGAWLRRLGRSVLVASGLLKHMEYSYVILARK